MDIQIGDYGRMIFEQMLHAGRNPMPLSHWESIRKEAEPLVRQLLALNSKMKGVEYKIRGRYDGQEHYSDDEKIRKMINELLGVSAQTLKPGDIVCDTPECDVSEHDLDSQTEVDAIGRCGVYLSNGQSLDPYDTIIKIPDDWHDKREEYTSPKFWLDLFHVNQSNSEKV